MTNKLKDQTVWKVTIEEGEYVIRGKRGLISRYKDGDIDVWVLSNVMAGRLERSGWKAKYHYDDGAAFVRPFSDLNAAAKAIKARRRRHLSPERRKAGAELLARWRAAKKAPPTEALQPPNPVPSHPTATGTISGPRIEARGPSR